MKHLFNIGLFLFASISGFSQIMQASIGSGSTPTRIKIYIKPTTAVNGTISTIQFDVAVGASITPIPAIAVVGVPAFGITWNIDPSYIEGAYRHYQFTTATSPAVVIGAGVETLVMELEFSGGPVSSNNVSLQTFGFDNANGYPGGNSGNIIFFCSGAANSVEGQLYYTRPGTTVINNPSYTGPLGSSATVGGILLPVKWLSFNVIKQGNNALLNWAVANENANHHFEVMRSSNGISYTTIATVNKSANGSTTYNYTDIGINNLSATILYYRIRQVDIDGKSSFSDIRFISIDKKGNDAITIFPNPVTEGFYVSIPFNNRDNSIVKLNLISADGRFIGSKEITTLQASNYYFNIKDKALAAGEYYLQIIYEDKLMETKKLYVNK